LLTTYHLSIETLVIHVLRRSKQRPIISTVKILVRIAEKELTTNRAAITASKEVRVIVIPVLNAE